MCVSYNEKLLFQWDPLTGKHHTKVNFFDELKQSKITFILYGAKYRIYMGFSQDFNLHIWNENWIHLSKLYLGVGYVTCALFLEKESRLICGGVNGCHTFHLKVDVKHNPALNLVLNPRGDEMKFQVFPEDLLDDSPVWCKGIKFQHK